MDTIYYNAQDDEFWKDINDYEGLYMVSNLGRVKSLNYRRTGKERLMKPSPDKWGYLRVNLCKNGEQESCLVHQLVMEAFVGKCPDGYEVDHYDWKPSNNRLSNLRYLLAKENYSRKSPEWLQNVSEANKKKAQDQNWQKKHAEAMQKLHQDQNWRKSQAEAVRKANSKPVDQFTLDGQFVKRWPSATDAVKELGIKNSSISQCINGKRKSAGGFKWQYASKI